MTATARQERTYDRENYIDFRMRLLGDNDSGPTVLSPGIHSFPFKLGLPLGLPSTFLGRHGWIQYFCKCALREPSGGKMNVQYLNVFKISVFICCRSNSQKPSNLYHNEPY